MIIPKLHYISQGATPKEHLENIQTACSSGAELVQLRLENISEKKYLKLAMETREITSHFQTRLLINNHYKIAKEVKADGVHLEKIDFSPTLAMEYLYTWQIMGATAHTIQDCETLLSKKVDYISLGPFRATKDSLLVDLGLNGYTVLIESLQTETPIIGFGGISPLDVKDIIKTGVAGVAVSTEITRDFNNIKIFNELLKASSTDEKRYTF